MLDWKYTDEGVWEARRGDLIYWIFATQAGPGWRAGVDSTLTGKNVKTFGTFRLCRLGDVKKVCEEHCADG